MGRERIAWIGIIIVVLLIGLLFGRQFAWGFGESDPASFRYWFWTSRVLDLAVQVALIFVGALGVAALLPRGKEDQ